MSYELIGGLKKKAIAVSQACRVLGVSRSGYYSANKASLAVPKVCAASVHLQAAFAASGRTYGSRRLCAVLQSQGLPIGRHRVRSLMRANQLRSVWRRKFIHTTDSKHAMAVAENVLDRQFVRASPNEAWVSDITLYLEGVAIRYRHTRRGQHGHHLRLTAWDVDVAPRLTFAPYRDRTVAEAPFTVVSLH